jgi:preprotein translocase subunit YajC
MRKQSKQVGVIKDFQSKLAPGMVVQLTSGLHGRLTSIGETTVDVEIAEGVVTTWERAAVLKLVDSVEAGSTEADHLTGGGIPDDLSSLEDSDFDRDNDDDTDGTDRK